MGRCQCLAVEIGGENPLHLDKPGAADSQKQRPVTAVGIPGLAAISHGSLTTFMRFSSFAMHSRREPLKASSCLGD
jgi:acyl dehydratase